MSRVVQPLVCEAGRERAIADNSDDLVVVAFDVTAGGNAERRGNRRRGVSSAEGVVFAFAALEEARDAAFLTQRLERLVAPGQNFVRISLVSNVPHELIARRIEHVMQRDRELDDPESC